MQTGHLNEQECVYQLCPGTHPGPILGIETSCDETAAAVLSADGVILAEAVRSQSEHRAFGGVVPEIAARAHLTYLPEMTADVLKTSGLRPADLAAVAATGGPGLIGGLIVGTGFAKGVAIAANKPYIAVNHLESHALTVRLPGLLPVSPNFPYLLLLLSGGHCQCVAVDGVGQYRVLGTTLDDAVGEAFDKVAKLLGLPWPGGPALEQLATTGNTSRFALPRPLLGRVGCDFSFSGLKTAVAQVVASFSKGVLTESAKADIAACFQQAVIDILADRSAHAIQMVPNVTVLVAAGGVVSNRAVRASLQTVSAKFGLELALPPLRFCTDNAVMVAWTGLERLRQNLVTPLGFAPRPRWPLTSLRVL